MDGFGTPHTKQLHVIERFHLIEDGKVLEANVHVEDPGAFTMPWDAIQRFRQYEAAVRKVPIERLAQLASAPEGPLTGDHLRRESELLFSGRGRPAHTAGGRARFLMLSTASGLAYFIRPRCRWRESDRPRYRSAA